MRPNPPCTREIYLPPADAAAVRPLRTSPRIRHGVVPLAGHSAQCPQRRITRCKRITFRKIDTQARAVCAPCRQIHIFRRHRLSPGSAPHRRDNRIFAPDPDANLTASRWREGYRSGCPVRIRAAVGSRENAVSLWVPLVPLIRSITFATLLVELVVKGGVPRGTEGYRPIRAYWCPQYP